MTGLSQCIPAGDSIRIHHQLADSLRYLDPDRAQQYLDRAIVFASTHDCWGAVIESLLKKSDCAGFNLQMGAMEKFLSEAERVFDQKKDQLGNRIDTFQLQFQIFRALYYHEIGHLNRSMEHWQSVLQTMEKKSDLSVQDLSELLSAHLFIAGIHQRRGNYDEALDHYYRSTHYAGRRALKEGRQPSTNYLSTYLAQLFRKQGKPDSARYHMMNRLNHLERAYIKDERQRLRGSLISICNDLAAFYRELGKLDSSAVFLAKAEAYLAKNDPFGKRTQFQRGLNSMHRGLYGPAEAFFKQNLAALYSTYADRKSIEKARTYAALGDLMIRQERWAKGLENYQAALIQLVRDFQDTDYFRNPDLENSLSARDLLDILDKKSGALYEWSSSVAEPSPHFQAAWETTLVAVDLIDSIRVKYISDEDKYFLLESSYPIFSRAIAMALQQGPELYEKAFELSERSKAVVLFESLRQTQAELFAGIPSSELEKLQHLRIALSDTGQEIAQENDPSTLDRLRNEQYALRKKYWQTIETFENKHPRFYRLKYDLEPLPAAKIKNELLQTNQALIAYFTDSRNTYAFLIDPAKESIVVEKLPWDSASTVWAQTIKDDIVLNNDEAYIRKARGLYQKLLAPMLSQTEAEHLIIIPDGVLGYIPFDALLTAEVSDDIFNNYRKWPYLLQQKRISQCFSASMLWEMTRSASSSTNNRMLAYAPAYEERQQTAILTSARESKSWRPSPLVFNKTEVEKIANLSCATTVLDEQATKKHFLEHAATAGLIHIAAHARIYSGQPERSYIAFSNVADKPAPSYRLFIHEIYQNAFPADLLVLSGCETGSGKVVSGEGIISIARAFSYGGAKSLVTTLWSIDDLSTSNLMNYFYQHLKKGMAKDVALRQAKLEYLQQAPDRARAHPKYWAAFTPVGDMQPLKIRSCTVFPTPLFVIAIGIGLLGLIWWIVRRRYN